VNIYTLVEGEKGAKKVYEHWIPLVNSSLNKVDRIDDLASDNFVVYAAGGYPDYLTLINDAAEDIAATPNVDRLVIAVDSEDYSYNDKRAEIQTHVDNLVVGCDVYIVVQHFCFETWALGNRKFGPRNPINSKLISYREIHNVFQEDPEDLPPIPEKRLNRAQFAHKYLRAMINDRNSRLTYNKNRPIPLLHDSYFNEVNSRMVDQNHIQSFDDFITAFSA